MYVVRVCSSCKGKLGLFKSANSRSATKKLELFFLFSGEYGFYVPGRNTTSAHISDVQNAKLKGV